MTKDQVHLIHILVKYNFYKIDWKRKKCPHFKIELKILYFVYWWLQVTLMYIKKQDGLMDG